MSAAAAWRRCSLFLGIGEGRQQLAYRKPPLRHIGVQLDALASYLASPQVAYEGGQNKATASRAKDF